ncbi:MAG: hypothetical protein JO006_09530 [Paucibacter sp.]|nr:hypothetical protein [Roseateles sp.]
MQTAYPQLAVPRHYFAKQGICGRWFVAYRGACGGLIVVADAPTKHGAQELADQLNTAPAEG